VELVERIKKLKEERNAIIVAHNYQTPAVQDIADYVGDSLELARKTQNAKKDVIVFCGVDFMAETAAIVNPEKKVLLPAWDAMCPMAAMLPPETVKAARQEHPDAEVVMYINTTAAAKAYADCVCTSSNAVRITNSMDAETVLFAPDKNLAHYVAGKTQKRVIPVPERGFCVVHENIRLDDVLSLKKEHPDALLTVHPECRPEIQDIADHIGSTKQMIDYVKGEEGGKFIIGTEVDIIHRMKKEAKGKVFIPACSRSVCKNMKKITLENVCDSLDGMAHQVRVPGKIAEKARNAIERMLSVP
jgi:quinolinate synthase